MSELLRVGALISGGGRTALNLQAVAARGELPIEMAVVVAVGVGDEVVGHLRDSGLHVVVIPMVPPLTRDSLDNLIDSALAQHGVQLVCLCGYLRLFRVGQWRGRTLNIHPSLLPRFGGKGLYGERVHRAVLEAGERESGCTVHLVDDRYDTGEVLVQRRCPVLTDDTPASLAARVFSEELLAFPQAISIWIDLHRIGSAQGTATEPS